MSLYSKEDGKVKKISGLIEQRYYPRYFDLKRIYEDEQELYIISDDATDYYKIFNEKTLYQFRITETNTTETPKIRLSVKGINQDIPIIDASKDPDGRTIEIGSLLGVYQMYTLPNLEAMCLITAAGGSGGSGSGGSGTKIYSSGNATDFITWESVGYISKFTDAKEGDLVILSSEMSCYIPSEDASRPSQKIFKKGDVVELTGTHMETEIEVGSGVYVTFYFVKPEPIINIVGPAGPQGEPAPVNENPLICYYPLRGYGEYAEDLACDSSYFNREPIEGDKFSCIYQDYDSNKIYYQVRIYYEKGLGVDNSFELSSGGGGLDWAAIDGSGSPPSVSNNGMAIGYYANAYNDNSIAIGTYASTFNSRRSIAIGPGSVANSYTGSVALGNVARANGNNSIAIGHANSAQDYSIAIGYDTTAADNASIAIGNWVSVSGNGSIGIGTVVRARRSAIAIGSGANGSDYSVVIGVGANGDSRLSANNSIAIGTYSKADYEDAIAIGNNVYGNGYQSIAIGTKANGGTQSIAIGSNAKAAGTNSIAIGTNAFSNYGNTIAIGTNTNAYSEKSIVIGYNTKAVTSYAIAIGINSNVNAAGFPIAINGSVHAVNGIAIGASVHGQQSIAIGRLANVNTGYSVAIGYNANCVTENTITLGDSNIQALECSVDTITKLSDERTKEDIMPANTAQCLVDVERLPVKRFKFKKFARYSPRDVHITGFIAQDTKEVFPKSILTYDEDFPVLDENGEPVMIDKLDDDGNIIYEEDGITPLKEEKRFTIKDVLHMDTNFAVPTLWGAVQELAKRLAILESRV